jgi:hypothetical protein
LFDATLDVTEKQLIQLLSNKIVENFEYSGGWDMTYTPTALIPPVLLPPHLGKSNGLLALLLVRG